MMQKSRLPILAVIAVLSLLLRAPAMLSSTLVDIGSVALNKALVVSPDASASQALVEAEMWLNLALAFDAGNRGARRGLGWVLLMQGREADAAAAWRAAGLTAHDFLVRGEQARFAGGYAQAEWWYEQAALLAPDLGDAWRDAGLTAQDLIARGDRAYLAQWHDEALWWYTQAEVLDAGSRSSALYLQYLALTGSGEASSALSKLQQAVSVDQGWLDPRMRFHAWYLWGSWLYEEGRNVEAEDALANAIAAHPGGEQLRWEHSESYHLLGLVQQSQEDYEQAVQSLAKAVEVSEGNAWAHVHLGQALYSYDVQRAPEVDREFSLALGLQPDDGAMWTELVLFWGREGESERVASLYRQAQQKGILSAQDLLSWGNEAREGGRYAEAQLWYGAMEVLEPELEGSALYLQYLTLTDSGDTDSALDKLQQAVSVDQGWLDPGDRFLAWHFWGTRLHDEGRHGEAENALLKAVSAYPGGSAMQPWLSHTHRTLGLAQQAQDRLEEALQNLELAVELNENSPWAHSDYGRVLYRYDAGRVEEVEEEFLTALSLRPDDVTLWDSLVDFWVREGEVEKAQSLYLLAEQKGVFAAQDLVAWGDDARDAGQYEEALWWYGRLEVLEPELRSSTRYLQYLTLKDSGDMVSALAKLQEAISVDQGWLDPGDRFLAWYFWGTRLYYERRDAEAENALSKAVALYPGGSAMHPWLSHVHRTLGLAQQAQGRLEEALQNLELAVQLNENSPWAHSDYGRVLYRYDAGRVEEVEKEFLTALSLRPDDVTLWENLILFWLQAGEEERATSLCVRAQGEGIVSGLEEVCPVP